MNGNDELTTTLLRALDECQTRREVAYLVHSLGLFYEDCRHQILELAGRYATDRWGDLEWVTTAPPANAA